MSECSRQLYRTLATHISHGGAAMGAAVLFYFVFRLGPGASCLLKLCAQSKVRPLYKVRSKNETVRSTSDRMP